MFIGKTERKLLPRADDRISYIYLEKCRIEQTEFSIQVLCGTKTAELPIAQVNAMMLGPGTTITHGAIKTICDVGCSIIWCGMEQWRFYAAGSPGTSSSKNLLIQMRFHENKTLRTQIVRDMYKIRYPEEPLSRKTLSELRGIEGAHVKTLYEELASKYQIKWEGRSYKVDCFEEQDDINKAITVGNQILYGVVRSVLHLVGFSSAIGFIHTGKMDSFVYDIADLYKEKISIPAAFFCASMGAEEIEMRMRVEMRYRIVNEKIVKQIIKDLRTLFQLNEKDVKMVDELTLWNGENGVSAGRNYAE